MFLAMVSVFAGLAFGQQDPARAPDDERQKQIEALKKEILELSRKLDALSQSPSAKKAEESKSTPIPEGYLKRLTWRSIGPANMGGRITALSVFEADPCTYFVATGGGGLLKTENKGLTFKHHFDKQDTVAIGDVAVAPSDKKIVWVGTGENNPRNSVSYGDGVYKSTDGGDTWTNMGLKETFQIGKILIHPKDPNIVYVGALGRLYGPNPDRGLYKTTDGGKTWDKILFIDDKTGVIDMAMHPTEPDTLLVATYVRQRDLYDTNDPSVKFGPGAGLHRTTDGGKTWTKLAKGLPTCQLGRIGLDYYRKDPKIVYAIVESEQIGTGPVQPPAAYFGVAGPDSEDAKAELSQVVEDGPAGKAGLKAGDTIIEADGKPIKAYSEVIALLQQKKPGDKLKLKRTRADKTEEIEVTLGERPQPRQAGQARDPRKPFLDNLGGQRENIQSRQGDEGWQYGGIYRSEDGGDSWTRVNSLNPRPMYFSLIRVDPSDDKYVYVGGVSLYRSNDGGKTFRSDGGRGVHADHHAMWVDPKDGRHILLGSDGGVYVTCDRMANWDHLNQTALGQFYDVAVDPRRNYNVVGGLQDNGTWGGPSRLMNQSGPVNEDWMRIGSGDGFGVQIDPNDPNLIYWTSQNGGLGRRNIVTGEESSIRPAVDRTRRQAQGEADPGPRYRWNWNSPFVLSKHNSRIYYTAANVVFRSLDRGSDLKPISKELCKTDKGSATSISESPRDPAVLYVGTDDGALWVTKNSGADWSEISDKVGLPKPMHVASIEASRYADGRVYVAFDGHRSDLDTPFIYVSEDFGQTWKSLNGDLPRGSTRVLREDIANPDVLFVGTEFKAYASIDRGQSWTSLNTNLPTVAVFELAVHPRAEVGEMVAATHGRSLWIIDATPLRQLTPAVLKSKAHLFQPNTYQRGHSTPVRGRTNRRFAGENPANGVPIYYHLAEKAGKISLKVFDAAGDPVRTLAASGEPGLQRSSWDLARVTPQSPRPRPTPEPRAGGETTGEGTSESESETARPQQAAARPGGGGGGTSQAPAGTYRVVLSVDGKDYVQTVTIEADPLAPPGVIVTEQDEHEEEEEEEEGGRHID